MKYRKINPTSAGRRGLVLPISNELTVKDAAGNRIKPTKSLLLAKRRTNGRNNMGHITTRHRGGGHKRQYRLVDFKRAKFGIEGTVQSIEYDPNRTAFIALVFYADGEKSYILAPKDLQVGQKIMSGDTAPFKVGNAMALKLIPVGLTVHAIEIQPGKGAAMVRSAGTSAQLLAKEKGYAMLKMPSGETRMVPDACMATIGELSNASHNLRKEGKAGRMRWKGVRPTVRGTAMNPVDHPHGGGEGKHNGYIPQTPWSLQTKGKKTRRKKKSRRLIVQDRRKK